MSVCHPLSVTMMPYVQTFPAHIHVAVKLVSLDPESPAQVKIVDKMHIITIITNELKIPTQDIPYESELDFLPIH